MGRPPGAVQPRPAVRREHLLSGTRHADLFGFDAAAGIDCRADGLAGRTYSGGLHHHLSILLGHVRHCRLPVRTRGAAVTSGGVGGRAGVCALPVPPRTLQPPGVADGALDAIDVAGRTSLAGVRPAAALRTPGAVAW